jgi:hypothetical protein
MFIIVLFLFTSCITKKDISELENKKTKLEDKYSTLEEEINNLKIEIDDSLDNLSDIDTLMTEQKEENDNLHDENTALESEIPVPSLTFYAQDINLSFLQVLLKEQYYLEYTSLFDEEPDSTKIDDKYTKFTYILNGDLLSGEYLTMSYKETTGNYIIYEIILECTSSKYEAQYNDFVEIATSAFVTLIETPFFYQDGTLGKISEIIDDGSYFDGKYIIEQTLENDVNITRIYAKN